MEILSATDIARRRIRELRQRRGMRQDELAAAAARHGAEGVTRDVIANIESGRRPYLSLDEWVAVAWALGASPIALLLPSGDPERFALPGSGIDGFERSVIAMWLRGQEDIHWDSPGFVGAATAHLEFFADDPATATALAGLLEVRGTVDRAIRSLMGRPRIDEQPEEEP